MDGLSKELLGNVLRFLPPTDLLRSAPFVSKDFHAVVDNDSFWLSTCKNPSQMAFLTRHQVQRSQLFDYYRSAHSEQEQGQQPHRTQRPTLILPNFLGHGNILVPRATAVRLRRGGTRRACVASSTDHVQEQVENCLMEEADESLAAEVAAVEAAAAAANSNNNNDRADDVNGDATAHRQQHEAQPAILPPAPWIRWWSSAPTPTDDTSDVLLFSFRYPLASISAMYLKPLQDPYYENGPVYTWRKTILRVYNIPAEQLQLQQSPPPGDNAAAVAAARHPPPPLRPLFASAPCSFPVAPGTAPDDLLRGHRIVNAMGAGIFVVGNGPIAPSDRPTIDHVLHGLAPVLEREYVVPSNNNNNSPGGGGGGGGDILSYHLPLGVIGNVIAVELVGKRFEQRRGSGYFACVERVECVGIPLDAAVEADDADDDDDDDDDEDMSM